jgi:hypothetical protein
VSALPPLTHHEILQLIGPASRRDRLVDLAATDRLDRRIAFRPRELEPPEGAPGDPALPPLSEHLSMENHRPGHFSVTRWLETPDGLRAALQADGPDLGVLLDRVDAVPPQRQFSVAEGTLTALSYRLPSSGPHLVLREAMVRLAGLVLHVKVSGVSGYPAEFELLRGGSDVARVPEDLFAVLGRPWSHLTSLGRGWLGSVQLRGREPQRSRNAETLLQRMVAHLAQTLAEPPARFHERHWRARWKVAFRGSLPLLVGGAIVGTAWLLQRQGAQHESVLALLANVAPPLWMGLFFLRREMPRIALPRVPRPPAAGDWRPAP